MLMMVLVVGRPDHDAILKVGIKPRLLTEATAAVRMPVHAYVHAYIINMHACMHVCMV